MKRTKRTVYAQNALPAGSDYKTVKKYVETTRDFEQEFEEPQMFSIQFYDEASEWVRLCDREIYVLTHSYKEAWELAKIFCNRWGFSRNKIVVQFPYLPVSYWGEHTDLIEHLGSIHYLKIW